MITEQQWDLIFYDLLLMDKTELAQGILEQMSDEEAERYLKQIKKDKENECL